MTETQAKKNPREVTLKRVRCSFPTLFTPRAYDENSTPEYSVQLLFPPDYNLSELIEARRAAMAETFGTKMPEKKDMASNCTLIKKMEEKQNDDGSFPPGYMAGGQTLRVKNTSRPPVFDRQAKLTDDESLVYSGCYINAHLRLRAYTHKGKWGVSYYLEAVQFVGDGDRLDGRRPVTDVFKPLEGETPPAAAGEATSDQDALFG